MLRIAKQAIGIAVIINLIVSGAEAIPFSDDAGQFEVDFPGEPVFATKQGKNDLGPYTHNVWKVNLEENSHWTVMYTDFARTPTKAFRDGTIKRSAGKNKLLRERNVAHNGLVGREMLVITTNSLVIRSQQFYVERRLYQVMYVGPPGSENTSEVETFMNSFRVKQKVATDVTPMPASPPKLTPDIVRTPSSCVEALVADKRACLKVNDVFKDCPGCPEMVIAPAPTGRVTIGSPESEKGRGTEEGPQHQIAFGMPFAVGRFAVTRGEFTLFANETGKKVKQGCMGWTRTDWKNITEAMKMGADIKQQEAWSWRSPGFLQDDRHPVVCVSWGDAVEFIDWLSTKAGRKYRLLTEAEREYIARAETATSLMTKPFWWGDALSTGIANYNPYNVFPDYTGPTSEWRKKTLPVDSFRANPWGLYNVHGNVYDWVEDCYHENYRDAPQDGSAWTTGDCGHRVLRGGSHGSGPAQMRAAARGKAPAVQRFNTVGFRVARTLGP